MSQQTCSPNGGWSRDCKDALWLGLILALLTWPALVSPDDDGDAGDDVGFADTVDLKGACETVFSYWFLRTRQGVWVERLGEDALSTARQSLDLNFKYKAEGWRRGRTARSL